MTPSYHSTGSDIALPPQITVIHFQPISAWFDDGLNYRAGWTDGSGEYTWGTTAEEAKRKLMESELH